MITWDAYKSNESNLSFFSESYYYYFFFFFGRRPKHWIDITKKVTLEVNIVCWISKTHHWPTASVNPLCSWVCQSCPKLINLFRIHFSITYVLFCLWLLWPVLMGYFQHLVLMPWAAYFLRDCVKLKTWKVWMFLSFALHLAFS